MSELALPSFPAVGSPELQAWGRWLAAVALIGPVPGGHYVSRDGLERICRRVGAPAEVNVWWPGVVAMRRGREPGLRDEAGVAFELPVDSYSSLASSLGAAGLTPEFRGENVLRPAVIPDTVRERALREEAVASCLLDGIAVDRRLAMEMLESGREPRNREETAVRQAYLVLRYHLPTGDSLTVEGIFELHRLLTRGSAENPDAAGRVRRDGEAPDVRGGAAPADVPAPPATELEHRLSELLRFIRPDAPDLLYDSVRAIVANFWIAYERPFAEANGRLARVLFYALLQTRYHPHPGGLVSISSRWVRAPRAYADAFRDARTDHDMGYFVHGQLRILCRAVQRLLEAISGIRETGATLRDRLPGVELNERQTELLAEARAHPSRALTIDSHRRRSGVVYQTARTDLLRLAELGLLDQEKEGRAFVFRPTERLAALLAR